MSYTLDVAFGATRPTIVDPDPGPPSGGAVNWRRAFRTGLTALPDRELVWERDQWRRLGAPLLAAQCEIVLADRQAGAWVAPPPASVPRTALSALWRSVDQGAVLAMTCAESLPLLTAARIWWLTRRAAA